MKLTGGDTGINLYEGYLRLLKKEKSGEEKKSLVFLPLIGIAAILLAVAAFLFLRNGAKQKEIAALDAEVNAVQPEYDRAQSVSDTYQNVDNAYQNLAASHFLYDLYPTLTRKLIERVQDCAGTVFEITNYGFDETTGALVLHATADSVNDVPDFITSLRDTELFTSVQYTGYTSDTDGNYYCTVGCMLDMSVLQDLSDVLTAEGEVGEAPATQETDAADSTGAVE